MTFSNESVQVLNKITAKRNFQALENKPLIIFLPISQEPDDLKDVENPGIRIK